ncbi:hypothetical protein V2G26_006470 [Clonostachys chloroleuca]
MTGGGRSASEKEGLLFHCNGSVDMGCGGGPEYQNARSRLTNDALSRYECMCPCINANGSIDFRLAMEKTPHPLDFFVVYSAWTNDY